MTTTTAPKARRSGEGPLQGDQRVSRAAGQAAATDATSRHGSRPSATTPPTKAENIAAGERSGAAALAQSKASPPHRAILLKSKLRVMGVGRSRNANSTFDWYWTADFGGTVTKTMPI